ncbi:hypothetical protein ACPOL_0306 [Acidisarcina polymorpha]|uniref:Uncharacterized protein n=1 Tax=Acidisarcina polymorpha TaxID=2211140 RepID=A0A2Z5FSB8_9BACT|nr:hypothetical protein ACPOL_0306 [Acidisarcina polymorpha]
MDPAQVRILASIGCPVADIGKVLGCGSKTLERRFMREMEIGRAERNTSLRRRQVELALAGNVTMLIWLGKQYLGQKDKQEVMTGEDGNNEGPIRIASRLDLSRVGDADLETLERILADAHRSSDDLVRL